jgi:histidinol-phosphatase (PHP family)
MGKYSKYTQATVCGMRAARFDYHVHERYSSDARDAKVEDYIVAAEERGIEEIAFTTHMMITGPYFYFGVQLNEVSAYIDNIHKLNETTNVRLRVGLEMDYFPDAEHEIEKFTSEYPFDFILGSTHYVRNYDVGSKEDAPNYFSERSISDAVSEYHNLWRRAVESSLFDSMAHPDYWKRYLFLIRPEPADFSEYGGVQEAIDSLVSYNVGIEVNASGWRHQHGVQYPIRGFLEAAHKAGLKRVTIGSDSHNPAQLGYRLPDAVDLLRDVGFKHISTFNGRKNTSHPIGSVVRTIKNK